ncbi:MAG: CHASE2 domain-containing protein, partial [Elusimicrobiota bacterium]
MAKGKTRAKAQAQAQAVAKWYTNRRRLIQVWAHILLPGALLLALLAVRVSGWSWIEEVQHKTFDMFQRVRPRAYEPAPVRVIDIDDESLARLGQWPWPRTLVARLVRRLNELGAAVVSFDVVFAEPDRTSPARVAASWPDTPETRALRGRVTGLPDHDRILAQTMKQAGNVVTGFVMVPEDNGIRPGMKATFAFAGDGPLAYVYAYGGVVASLPELEKAAAGNGSFSIVPEPDGIVRLVPLIMRQGQNLLPTLALEALRVAQGAASYAIKSSGASGAGGFGAHTGISKIKVGRYVAPTDGRGCMWVYLTADAPARTIPAWKVFEKDFDRTRVDGGILFVGTSAAGLKDLRATPLNPAAAGVEVHANAAEQILLGRFLQRPDWAAGAEVLYMLVLGLLLLFLLPRVGALWCAFLALGGAAGALAFSWKAFTGKGFLVDPVFPCLTALGVYMVSSLV